MKALLHRLVAATFVVAATGATLVGTTAAPASSATCADAGGVSVVVDFGALGGGVRTSCDTSGAGKSAAAIFVDNGFPLTYATRSTGFVCRVSGVPQSDPCIEASPETAYWGLYWSNGTSGSWTYSSLGAQGLTVPDGGSVGWSWQGGATGPPGIAAPVHAQAPTPSPTPPSATPTSTPPPKATPTKPAKPAGPTKSGKPPTAKTPTQTSGPKTPSTKSANPNSGTSTSGTPGSGTSGTSSATPEASAFTAADAQATKTAAARSKSPGAKPGNTGASGKPKKGDSTQRPESSADPTQQAAAVGASRPTDTESPPSAIGSNESVDPGQSESGSIPMPIILGLLGALGFAAAGTAVVRSRRTQ